MPLKLELNDKITTKKSHPCGSTDFLITRTGMDFRIKCMGCEKEIWIARPKLEKRIKKVIRDGNDVPRDEWV